MLEHTSSFRYRCVMSSLLAILVWAAACGESSTPSDSTKSEAKDQLSTLSPSPTPTPEIRQLTHIESGAPPVHTIVTLRTMVESYHTVIVGRVLGISDVRQPTPLDGNEQVPTTVFSVKVERVLASPRVKEGDTIMHTQWGGTLPDGRSLIAAKLIEPGETYLMFLVDLQPATGRDEFTSSRTGRFVITEDGLIEPNGWEVFEGAEAVSGVPKDEVVAATSRSDWELALKGLARVKVDAAETKIQAAIAEGPLPPAFGEQLPDG